MLEHAPTEKKIELSGCQEYLERICKEFSTSIKIIHKMIVNRYTCVYRNDSNLDKNTQIFQFLFIFLIDSLNESLDYLTSRFLFGRDILFLQQQFLMYRHLLYIW